MSRVRGVGPERMRLLARLEIHTVGDLLLHRPRRYEDRRKFRPIRELQLEEAATVRGRIIAAGVKRWKMGARSRFECVLDDGTARLHCRWWQAQSWMPDWYAVGREFLVYGKPNSLKPRNMDHPETELIEPGEDEYIHVNRIVPIHPLTEGLTARVMRAMVWSALEQFEGAVPEPEWSGLPGAADRPLRGNALHMLHFPEELTDVEIARQRLALDEFVELQRGIRARRRKFEQNAAALPCAGDNHLMKPFLAALGFKLTGAQTRVLREIRADLGGEHPMRRLLQGDVGSGKTAVAACAALMTLESGYSVALMAPTEILAEQHERNFRRWFGPLGLRVSLQTGSQKTAVVEQDGPAQLVIGTHALFAEGCELPRLGLVIIDEQHKFGVAQREALVRKGTYPHLLVMTATPIPRTLGLTLYGDLDGSVIDELPGGRGALKTFVRGSDTLPKVFAFLRQQLAAGRQAYVVYPRVDVADTEKHVKAVTKELANVQAALGPFRAGLLHGRLKAAEKEAVMAAFRANQVQVLVATSLIEVGVDVPNATVMIIENAEQFGLAQLHQLRGRIGRGSHESYCVLVSDADQPEAAARLKVLAETNDGFRIAEADLKLRGPGELLGQRQSGDAPLRFGDLIEDLNLIRQAREIAGRLPD